MSESTSSPAPGAAQPEPTSGTPAGTVEAVPAASSAEVVAEPVVTPEPVVEAPKPSLASEAKAEEPVKEEPKAEPAVKDEPKTEVEPKVEDKAKDEPKAEEPKEEPKPEEKKPDEPKVAPVFEKYKLPEGVTVEEARLGSFNDMLGEIETRIATDPAQAHAAMQDLGQKLVDFHIAEMTTAAERAARHAREHWDRTREDWVKQFRDDPEIGKNRTDTSLSMIGSLVDMYGTTAGAETVTKLRDAWTATGMGDHPEMLRFMHWAASRLVETRRIVVPQPTAKAPARTPSQKLYGNTSTMRTA